jgi:diguanylate cyclase (GGDEF)-like protein/PAS domain S-box-containing protein
MRTPSQGSSPFARARAAILDFELPAFFAAYGVAYILWILGTGAADEVRSLVANLGYVPLGLLSAALTWQISRLPDLPRRERSAWRLMTSACLLSAASDIVWTIEANVLGRDPSAGVANLGYLLFYPALLASLMLLPGAMRTTREWLRFSLDAATVVVGGAMAIWHFVITPALATGAATRLGFVLALAYPLGDLLLLLGIAAVLLRCPRGPRQRPLLLLAGSFTAMLIADVVWAGRAMSGTVSADAVQDAVYIIGYVLFAIAATAERGRLRRDGADGDTGRPVGGLPYISVALGYGLVVIVAWQHTTAPALFPLILGGVCLALLALARQLVAIRENVQLQRERTLLAGELWFKSIVQHGPEAVSVVDRDWTIRYASPAAADLLGARPAQLVGRSVLDLVHPDDAGDTATRLRDTAHDTRRAVLGARWRLRRGDGTYIDTENTCTNLLANEHVHGILLTTRDITDRAALEAQLVHQAFHDQLTGLANRALFYDRLQHALSRRRSDVSTVGILYLDLDDFKTVNDTLGHSAGDALLRAVGERLLSFLRSFDTAARLGGDEFAILIDDIRMHDHATGVAERVRQSLVEPFILDGREVRMSASIGIALAAPDQTAEELLRNADHAMYLAKQRGGGQAVVYEPGMQADAANRLELQQDLRRALERGELSLVYQPIHDLETVSLVGVEALLRWMHPTRGPIPPTVFVPIAEETGLIVAIGRWVLQQACADACIWRARIASTKLRVAVNISGRQIPSTSLVDDVTRALADCGLPPGALSLELTERVLLQYDELAVEVLHQLKSTGVRLAIDDFGTGYSSLTYLQRLPVDIMKIDRGFVARLEHDDDAAGLARTIVALARTMSMQTIAKGIENSRQAELLRQIGCNLGQGFFYGVPMPADELEDYAERWLGLTVS